MFDVRTLDRRVGARVMTEWVYTALTTVFALFGLMLCAWCSQISSDWDVAAWSFWQDACFFVLGLALMWGGAKFIEKFNELAITVIIGCAVVTASFGLVIGAFTALYDLGDMMPVFILAIIFAVVMGIINMFMPQDARLFTGAFGVMILVSMGGLVESLTWFTWICWVVLGLLLTLVSIAMMERPYTVRSAIGSLGAVFVVMVNTVRYARSIPG